MKRINSLSDLLMEELADLLNAENQLIEALPQMAEASQSLTLKLVFQAHLEVTKAHANRLKDIFSNIGQSPQKVGCRAMKKLIEENVEIVNETEKSLARDAAIIGVAQRMEHYEIAGYGTACEHAANLGHTRIMELLDKTLNEERAMNLHLSELAQGMINIQAIAPNRHDQQQEHFLESKGKGFYISEKKFTRRGSNKRFKGRKRNSGQEGSDEK